MECNRLMWNIRDAYQQRATSYVCVYDMCVRVCVCCVSMNKTQIDYIREKCYSFFSLSFALAEFRQSMFFHGIPAWQHLIPFIFTGYATIYSVYIACMYYDVQLFFFYFFFVFFYFFLLYVNCTLCWFSSSASFFFFLCLLLLLLYFTSLRCPVSCTFCLPV